MKNPPDGWPRITPAVFYDDAGAAIDWLTSAFGFEVQERIENEQGQVVHSQLALNGGLIMVGQAGLTPGRTYPRSPQGVDGANTQSLMVYVDDADAHCAQPRTTARTTGLTEATRSETSRVTTGGSCSVSGGSRRRSGYGPWNGRRGCLGSRIVGTGARNVIGCATQMPVGSPRRLAGSKRMFMATVPAASSSTA